MEKRAKATCDHRRKTEAVSHRRKVYHSKSEMNKVKSCKGRRRSAEVAFCDDLLNGY